jgi:superfamily II helicase
MRTYRWEIRFLSFVFGIAEANAFSCFKIWGNQGDSGIHHSEFKDLLASSLLAKVKEMREVVEIESSSNMRLRNRLKRSSHVLVSLSNNAKRVRRVCSSCRNGGSTIRLKVEKRCSCSMDPMCINCYHVHLEEEMRAKFISE